MKRKAILIFLLTLLISPISYGQYNDELNKELFNEYKGEILFSENPIDLSSYSETDFQTDFQLMDDLYAQIVLKNTLENVYKEHNYVYDFNNPKYTYNYALRLNVDGKKAAQWNFELNKSYFTRAVTFDVVLSNNDPKVKRNHSDFVNDWVQVVSTLPEGKHKISLEVVPLTMDLVGNRLPVIAQGEFKLEIKKSKVEKFLASRTTDVPPATLINKGVEEKIVQASEEVYPYAEPVKAYITDVKEDWTYGTDENGFIRSRHIVASVVYQTETNNSCWVKSGLYSQQHRGNGSFGVMGHAKEVTGYYDYQIPCWKVTSEKPQFLSTK